MSNNMINLGINEDMIMPVLEKQIQAAIMANIGNPEELIEKVVSGALKQKVNERGVVDSYSSNNKFDYLEVLTTKAIREAANETLAGWLKENAELVKQAALKEMNKPERQNTIAKAFADAVEESLSCSWLFSCNINLTKKGD